VEEAVLEDQPLTRNLYDNEDHDEDGQLQSGTVLEGRYQIDGILGIGGMGAVYLARDNRFKVVKHVAVKEIIAHVRDESVRDTLVKTFEREANMLATVNHPAIPKIHDYFTIDKRSYLVMQFIEGHDLEKIIERTDELMSMKQIVVWAIDLCDVLHYLHTHDPEPIVFRDVKPSNIMITPDKNVVLVDFGIAKEFEAGQKGTMIGTEGYSPPEQYRGEASPQVDIYALGATLHHLLTGVDPRDEAPFTFSDRPIRQLNPDIPEDLEIVIETALQYNASERFEDANMMKEALIQIARKSGTPYNIKGTMSFADEYEIQPIWTFECEDEISGPPLLEDGLIYIGAYDNNIYALDAESGKFAWKYACDGGIVSTPAQLGRGIFFGSEDQRLHAVSTPAGRIMWTYYTDAPIRSSPTVQDRHVFIGSDDEHLHIVNASSRQPAHKINASAPVRSSPLVHNDAIYFGTEAGDFLCSDFSG